MLTTGIRGRASCPVTAQNTAAAVGSGALEVFATPVLAALVEEAAWKSVQPGLEPGCGTVGTALRLNHTAATPVGGTVIAECELVEIDRRRLVFRFTVRDGAGPVADGEHERFIVRSESFLAKARARSQA
ncbi:MAG TPA: thioesterase family protein [Candidatus Gemmiger faecigallinarum]|nr:thioesterase family protein [Candidatus Gemmiger faecigallinarum]